MSVILHGPIPSTYTQTVYLALKHKGVDFTLAPAMPHSEEQKKRHPWGRVPALEHNGDNQFETSAIIYYIDDVFDGPALIPTGELVNRMKYQKWITVVTDYLYPNAVRDTIINRMEINGPLEQQRLDDARENLEHNINILSVVLDTNNNGGLAMDGLCGSDYLVWPIVNYLVQLPEQELVQKHDNLVAWHSKIAESDAGKSVMGEIQKFREAMQAAS